jgi:hypothetical protein
MDDDRMAKLERRLDDLDQRSSAMERAMDKSRAAMNSMVPKETRQHLRATGREGLLAVRSLLDHWVDKFDDAPDKGATGREKIPID